MIRNIVFYSKKICFCLIVFLFSSIIMIMNVSAASYSMDDYQEVIEKVNETYDKKITIADYKTFGKNIFNKISPNEFEEMLIGNNTQDKFSKQVYVQDEFNSDRAINEVVTYFAPIRFGNWTSEVSAKIETTFFSDSIPKFIRFVAGGYEWDANSSSWSYYAMIVKCESFSSSSCKVSYNGYWMIPLTGVVDTNYVTYNITYNPY